MILIIKYVRNSSTLIVKIFLLYISDQHEASGGDVARDREADHRGQVHDGGLPNQGRHG